MAAGEWPGKGGEGEKTPVSSIPTKPRTDIQAALTVLGRRSRQPNEPPINLRGTDLRGADLRGAIRKNAYLNGAKIDEANLKMADLAWAHLEEASLYKAHLEKTILSVTHLEGADLTGATGLTQEQIDLAITDGNTSLPDYLTRESGTKE